MSRLLQTAVALLTLATCGSFLVGCEEDSGPRDRVVISANAPDDESWNATIVLNDSTGPRARVRVGHVRRYLATSTTILDSGVQVEFFAAGGGVNAILTSDSARIDDRTRDMSAYGRVHVVSRTNGTVVDSDRLFWDEKRRKLHSDSHVRMNNPERDELLEGSGFESDETLRSYTIFNVTGRTRAPR